MAELPSVSIIIPTKNRPVDLCRACESLWRQTVCPKQVIIVDQGSGTEAREAIETSYRRACREVQAILKLDYVWDPNISGSAVARNRAMEIASGDIWLFLDDDVILEPGFLEELVAIYACHPRAAGVSGVVTNYPRPSWFSRLWSAAFVCGPFADDRQPVYWRAERLRNDGPVRVTRLGGGLMSFRAEAVRRVRFDENLTGVSDGEDVDFCARLGPQALLLIAPKARLTHNQSPAGRERSHWLARHARAQTYLYRRNWRRGVKNRLCYVWLNFGYALMVSFAALRRASLQPWRSLLAGAREGARAATRRSGLPPHAKVLPFLLLTLAIQFYPLDPETLLTAEAQRPGGQEYFSLALGASVVKAAIPAHTLRTASLPQ
jgi:GT2 family glycosyltransferase